MRYSELLFRRKREKAAERLRPYLGAELTQRVKDWLNGPGASLSISYAILIAPASLGLRLGHILPPNFLDQIGEELRKEGKLEEALAAYAKAALLAQSPAPEPLLRCQEELGRALAREGLPLSLALRLLETTAALQSALTQTPLKPR